MARSIKELKKEGEKIARELGNGVRYAGPQINNGELAYHLFNDDAVTDASFTAQTIEDAKKGLIIKREKFGAKPPTF
jgi:hypothetical protein